MSRSQYEEWEEANEYDLLKKALQAKGFECYNTGEWYKHFTMSGRVVTVSYNGDSLRVDFNEEEQIDVSPKTLIKCFLGV